MPLNLIQQIDINTDKLTLSALNEKVALLLRILNLTDKDISLVLMSDQEIATYNEKYRVKKGPTNVLAFPAKDLKDTLPLEISSNELGDILILRHRHFKGDEFKFTC